MPTDLRRHARYDVRLSAEFSGTRGKLETATTKNVSVGGAALELGHVALADGQDVKLSLFLVVEGVEDPEKPPLVVSAKVMWTGEGDDGSFTAGVRFEGITAEQSKWLERFLEVTA